MAASAQRKPGVAFVFSGQGAQWQGMGAAAYASSPTFRATIERLRAGFPGDVAAQLAAVFARGEEAEISSGPALTAFQLAAVNTLREEAGLAASYVMGYSVGEVAAAYAAGALSEADAFAVSLARGAVAR